MGGGAHGTGISVRDPSRRSVMSDEREVKVADNSSNLFLEPTSSSNIPIANGRPRSFGAGSVFWGVNAFC